MSKRKLKIRTVRSYVVDFTELMFLTCITTESIMVRTIFAVIYAYCLFWAKVDDYYYNQIYYCLTNDLDELIKKIKFVKYHFYASMRNIMICYDLLFVLIVYKLRNNLYTTFLTILTTIMSCTLTIYFWVKASTCANSIYENSDEV